MKQERTGGSHSIGSRFICRINVEKVFLMADNSGPIVISETYCRWTSYIIPEASTQPTKRIHSLLHRSSLLLFRLLPRNSPCFSACLSVARERQRERESCFRAFLVPWSLLLFALSTRVCTLAFRLSWYLPIFVQVPHFLSFLFLFVDSFLTRST